MLCPIVPLIVVCVGQTERTSRWIVICAFRPFNGWSLRRGNMVRTDISPPHARLPASVPRVVRFIVQEGPIGSTEQGHLDGLRIRGKQVESP